MLLQPIRKLLYLMSTDETTGKYSGHRVWYAISNITATGAIIKMSYLSELTVDFFIAYLAIVGGYSVASEMIKAKWNNTSFSPNSPVGINSDPSVVDSGNMSLEDASVCSCPNCKMPS
jgi:hypothetical protein